VADIGPAPRRRWTGLLQVLRYNWHLYALAAAGELAVAGALVALPLPGVPRVVLAGGAIAGSLWSAASVLVSHYVYDRSALYRWDWLRELDLTPAAWVNIHAGLDDTSSALTALYGASSARVLDIFDAGTMTEPSIRRARRERSELRAEAADFRRLPLVSAGSDAVFLVFAAHELRSREAKVRLFGETARVLRPGGRVVVVEHLRDAWNFAAFGPGFLHFFPGATWRSVMADARLTVRRELSVTPFVHVFVGEAP
jgi:SAM-dependent methyltransferase